MNSDLDRQLRQLMGELADSAPPPHPWTHRSTIISGAVRPRRQVVAVLALAAAVVLVVAGLTALALSQRDSGDADPDLGPAQQPDRDPRSPPVTASTTAPGTEPPPATTTPEVSGGGSLAPSTNPTDSVDDIEGVKADALATVSSYLAALEDGRYERAVELLDDGAVPWDERPDLAQLPLPPTTRPELALALELWCSDGALCQAPASLTVEEVNPTGGATLAAVFDVGGDEIAATFYFTPFEGSPHVQGLPPNPNVPEARSPTSPPPNLTVPSQLNELETKVAGALVSLGIEGDTGDHSQEGAVMVGRLDNGLKVYVNAHQTENLNGEFTVLSERIINGITVQHIEHSHDGPVRDAFICDGVFYEAAGATPPSYSDFDAFLADLITALGCA